MRSKPPDQAPAPVPAGEVHRRPAGPWQQDEPWLSREWLLVDGHGGFASGTLADLPTRRYHGWLCAWPESLPRRHLFVARCDEQLTTEAGPRSLLASRWQDGTLQVPEAAITFTDAPVPTWEFELGEFRLVRQLAMPGQAGVVLVAYENRGRAPLQLRLKPLLALRPADFTRHGPPPRQQTVVLGAGLRWQAGDDEPPLWLSSDAALAFAAEPVLYRGVDYSVDRERGYDHTEDLWSPGVVTLELAPGQQRVLAFAVADPVPAPAAALQQVLAQRRGRDAALAARWRGREWQLARGADDFLYQAPGGRTGVLAGFPWFVEWGRDVFVALPGLTLARGRPDRCEQVLVGALPFLRDGLLPNVYGRSVADSHYGSVDAALWFALAVLRWQRHGGGEALLRQRFVPALQQIAAAYAAGTGLGIRMGDDGLLEAGSEQLNATWMDAQTADGPVTPRPGMAIEINALWYSLLSHLAELVGGDFTALRQRCGEALVRRFWLADGAYLADRVHQGAADRSVRPNMVIAAALELSPLAPAQRRGVVDRAEAELLTPRGLRTLSPRDPAYRGRYAGGCEGRDRAYHQGTAWPWLCGFFVEAALRATTPAQRPALQRRLAAQLTQWLEAVGEAGLDHISEVYDGDPPQRPGGSFAQAWNSGELLRALELCRDGAR